MFGKSGDVKKIKALEETVKKLKSELANQKVQFNSALHDYKNYISSLHLVNKEIHDIKEDLKKVKNASPLNTFDVPNIPWIHEIITNPEGECFNCLPIRQKLKVWENIFQNIGFTAKYNILERFPFHFDELEMQEFSMTQLGHLYFSELGTGYDGNETCPNLINLRDLKMISEEYPQMINKIVQVIKPNTSIQHYKEIFDKEKWLFTLTFELDKKPVELIFEGTKYLDTACIDQLITHLKEDMEESKSFFSYQSDFAYNLCYINAYQKMMLEKIFRRDNLFKSVP